MAAGWKGVYEDGKWWSPVAVRVLSVLGFSETIRFPRASLDTGSPYTILPGKCLSPISDRDFFPDFVEAVLGGTDHGTILDLPPRGRVIGFGGVGGAKRDRYLFCAEISVDGLEYKDLVNVVFFDPDELPHPIVAIAEVVESGRPVTFSCKGFRMER